MSRATTHQISVPIKLMCQHQASGWDCYSTAFALRRPHPPNARSWRKHAFQIRGAELGTRCAPTGCKLLDVISHNLQNPTSRQDGGSPCGLPACAHTRPQCRCRNGSGWLIPVELGPPVHFHDKLTLKAEQSQMAGLCGRQVRLAPMRSAKALLAEKLHQAVDPITVAIIIVMKRSLPSCCLQLPCRYWFL